MQWRARWPFESRSPPTGASPVQAPPGLKPGPLLLYKSDLHICVGPRAADCSIHTPSFLRVLRCPVCALHTVGAVKCSFPPTPLAGASHAVAARAPPAGAQGNNLSQHQLGRLGSLFLSCYGDPPTSLCGPTLPHLLPKLHARGFQENLIFL